MQTGLYNVTVTVSSSSGTFSTSLSVVSTYFFYSQLIHFQNIFAGRQVPIFSYFSQHTPFFFFFFFFFFLAISSYFSYFFLAILYVTCISYISFQGFLFNFLFFLNGAHQLFFKIFQPHFLWHYFIYIWLFRLCIWPLAYWDGCRSAGRQC